MEDVNDDLEIIEHDPLTGWETIDRCGAQPVLLFQSRLNFVGNCFELRLRRGRTNDKEIGEAGNAGEIEHDNIFGLLVRGQFGAGRG